MVNYGVEITERALNKGKVVFEFGSSLINIDCYSY